MSEIGSNTAHVICLKACLDALPCCLSRSGCWFFPFLGFCVPVGLVWLYDTRSVRVYSIHILSLAPREIKNGWREQTPSAVARAWDETRLGGKFLLANFFEIEQMGAKGSRISLLTNSRRSQSEKQWESWGRETAARKPHNKKSQATPTDCTQNMFLTALKPV